jgi:N-terminal acetyltransferase B complex non-catalytic subunit
VLELLVAYFGKFGSKTCCFEDLSGYISKLEKEDAKEFCKQLRESYGEKSDTVKEISMQINLARFERFIGTFSRLSSAETMTLVNKFWERYEAALPLGMGPN